LTPDTGHEVESSAGSLGWRYTSAQTAAIALGVAVAYYIGSLIGFSLTLPPMSPSVLWPPNAILTATLLLTPPRRWALFLLAALPAHLAVQLPTLGPTPLVFVFFLTNCSEAIMAAAVVRRFAGHGPGVFYSLRSVVIFIAGAGFLAPIASSFLDAGGVALLRGDAYWPVWRTRVFSNTLTALTLVPSLVMVVGRRWSWPHPEIWRRVLEAGVLWLGLIVVGWGVFDQGTGASGFDVLLTIPLAFIVPFLVWAAVRLGPTGTSLSLMTVEGLAICGGAAARGPFAILPPAENVLSLQIVLISLAIPLLCLAALIEERQRAQQALEGRLRFEEVLSRLSRAFVHLPSGDVDRTIDVWLRRLGEHLGVRHITIFQLSKAAKSFVPTHSWTAHPEPAPGLELPGPTDDDDLHDVPLLITDSGVLSFGPRANGAAWSSAMIAQIRLVAEVFGNALARKQAEDALRLSEAMNAAILSSLTSSVAVLDQRGRVVAINEGWSPFLNDRRPAGIDGLGLGASYAEVCRLAISADSPYVTTALTGIQSVIDGTEPSFQLEWPRTLASGERWFEMSVLPLNRAEGGAVVSLTDITRRKQMEIEAQQTRQELAHFTRVSAMGELAASLAHELNQPLAGILANAQAGQRFLTAGRPDLEEIRAILTDIVADDRRAGEVIRRLREMLRKAAPSRVVLDLNALIGDVAKLLSSDALIRGLSIVHDFDPKLPQVTGDRVELQQVVLNLLVNAMEAMAVPDAAGRIVVVRTACADPGTVEVSVQDTGTGIGGTASIFEPFYTTKAEGLGMGLSIARSIIEAHGGRIWAENNETGGATFHFALAAAGQEMA
jgi:signal transduction histidine kinase/integral membrane sensor domain MASE1